MKDDEATTVNDISVLYHKNVQGMHLPVSNRTIGRIMKRLFTDIQPSVKRYSDGVHSIYRGLGFTMNEQTDPLSITDISQYLRSSVQRQCNLCDPQYELCPSAYANRCNCGWEYFDERSSFER